MFKDIPTKEIHSSFRYSEGDLYWATPKQGRRLSSPIRCQNSRGYVVVSYMSRLWPAHRIVWILHNGGIPQSLEVDHINRIKHDNRIENLRLLTRSQNLHNATAKRGNAGGCVGVNWVKNKNYWQATICVNYKQVYLGSNPDYFEACCIRKSAEVVAHKKMGL